MKELTLEQRQMAYRFAARLEQSRIERGRAILKAEEEARALKEAFDSLPDDYEAPH